jgi:hypothetical protein
MSDTRTREQKHRDARHKLERRYRDNGMKPSEARERARQTQERVIKKQGNG